MKAIRHAGIVVSDIDKALGFYVGLLGLKVKIDMLEEGVYIDNIVNLKNVQVRTIKMEADDGNLIELLWYKSHPRAPQPKEACAIGASHVAFTVDDLDKEYDRLRAAGVRFNCPPQISPNGKAKVTYCHDPDGTLIELVEPLAQ